MNSEQQGRKGSKGDEERISAPESPPDPLRSLLPCCSKKLLFTPGPLTTSDSVKRAMLHDAGSRDAAFIEVVRGIRERLLRLGGVSKADGFEAVLMQGSGTFGVEAVVGTALSRAGGKLLVVINGAYGERMLAIARTLGIPTDVVRGPETETPDPTAVHRALAEDAAITHVGIVHCETTTGILNPIEAIGVTVRAHGRRMIVDAMSSFGGVPIDVKASGADFLVSSSNKCIEGVPGFSFVIARREELERAEGNARSVSLDLVTQWRGLERDGQFRFTPPTHVLLAFAQALDELDAEGGVVGRAKRYAANHAALLAGMRGLGFRELLAPERQGHIITAFNYPDDPAFNFAAFYARLADRGMLIYPGKLTSGDCFRIGTIGRIFESDVDKLIESIGAVLDEMGVRRP